VHWRGRELSLVARTFLEFAIAYEPEIEVRLANAKAAFEETREQLRRREAARA
jgi:hypothetical protein